MALYEIFEWALSFFLLILYRGPLFAFYNTNQIRLDREVIAEFEGNLPYMKEFDRKHRQNGKEKEKTEPTKEREDSQVPNNKDKDLDEAVTEVNEISDPSEPELSEAPFESEEETVF